MKTNAGRRPTQEELLPSSGCRAWRDVDRYAAPPSLIESQHAQQTPRHVSGENRNPDVEWLKRARLLNNEADSERYSDLGDDRDVERTLGISSALQPPGVSERDGDGMVVRGMAP